MNNDMFLVRKGEDDGFINLAVGEPYFLDRLPFTKFVPHSVYNRRYPLLNGQKELIKQIKRFHGKQYKYVVVANGAKQALSAAFTAYKTLGFNAVYHKAPHWPTYPTLASYAGLRFFGDTEDMASARELFNYNVVNVCTSPNNPDGSQTVEECHVWDAAYAHSVYGHNSMPMHEVSVWSAAKLFGLSGLRVGWLCTNNEQIAEAAGNYVEQMTSGVCVDSQLYVSSVLDYVNSCDSSRAYALCREDLLTNGKLFNSLLSNYIVESKGVPVSGTGGFALFKVADGENFFKCTLKAKVNLLPGYACGMTEGENWFRMSCMHKNDFTELALRRIRKELDLHG